MNNILGIDYGEKGLGIAIGNKATLIATPLCQIKLGSTKKKLNFIGKIIKERNITSIVIGLPLSLRGKDSAISTKVRKFGNMLSKKYKIDVLLWDERLTTKQVEKSLIHLGVSKSKRARSLDKLSACIILQNYFDYKRMNPNKT